MIWQNLTAVDFSYVVELIKNPYSIVRKKIGTTTDKRLIVDFKIVKDT